MQDEGNAPMSFRLEDVMAGFNERRGVKVREGESVNSSERKLLTSSVYPNLQSNTRIAIPPVKEIFRPSNLVHCTEL